MTDKKIAVSGNTERYVNSVLESVVAKNPFEVEFLQAVREVLSSLLPAIEGNPAYRDAAILERLCEPERVITFRVPWTDDRGNIRVNRGYRIQFSSAIGPYKGGLRFHPSVNLSILKFLGFEQTLKNSLTGQAIGGAKGGSDFDPKDRSDNEVMRFCQSFMMELFRHIGPSTDIPAGDIGVGTREIGYLFGAYRKLRNEFTGVLTGKAPEWGGSRIRNEAAGYGCAYFAENMMNTRSESLEGKRCLVSGSGNVAQHCVQKLIENGARALTMSDSDGFIHDPDGIDREKLEWIKDLKNNRRGRIGEYVERFSTASYTQADPDADHNPTWAVEADCAFPCATQNEINGNDATNLLKNDARLVCEGANMPTTAQGQSIFEESDILYGPAKAANAGGVAVSALEMAQNSQREQWSATDVDARLQYIMRNIHDESLRIANECGVDGSYLHGANIAGFIRIADAMLAQGVV